MTLMRPPPDATDYLVPNNPGSQSPDTCSTLSCANDDKLLEIEDQMHLSDRNNIKMWNEDMIAQSMMPFNENINPINNYPNKQPFNSGIVLNPTSLNYQQPCVRYVNVNVARIEPFNQTMDPNHAPNLASSQANEINKAPVNC